MSEAFIVDWESVFSLEHPAELILRGSLIYLGLFALLRSVRKREAGVVGITNLLVIVLIADAAQSAMAGSYTSIPDGLVLVGTIVFWSYALEWLGYRFPHLQHLVRPRPLPLVTNGHLLRHNLRREFLTEEELLSQLRLQGCEDLTSVRWAYMEGDGRISVVRDNDAATEQAPQRTGE